MVHYTLKQILTFIEVAETGSVSKAAHRLFLTQPAVSMQLRHLEHAFGVALIEAEGRNIRLTQIGKEFLRQCQTIVGQLNILETLVADYVGVKRGALNIAVVNTVKYFFPMLLVKFKKTYENVEINLIIDQREAIIGHMERGAVELIILEQPPLQYDSVAFVDNPMGFLAAPSHALSRSKRIPYRHLAEQAFLVREEGSHTRSIMERLFEQNKVSLKILMEFNDNETIKQSLMAGMGVGFLSLRTVRRELSSGHLALLDVVDTPYIGQWDVAHLKNKRLSPVALAFKDFLLEQGRALIESWG